LLVTAFCLSDIVVLGRVSRRGQDDHVQFDIKLLWGMVRYHLVIPFARFRGSSVKLQTDRRGHSLGVNSGTSTEESVDAETVKNTFEKVRDMLRFTLDLTEVVKRMLRNIRLKEWSWTTTVGTGDAVSTAMTTGLAWSVKTSALGVLSQLVRLQTSPEMSVTPLFNATAFSTRLQFKAKIRVAAVAMSGVRLLIHAGRAKGGLSGWFRLLKDLQPRRV